MHGTTEVLPEDNKSPGVELGFQKGTGGTKKDNYVTNKSDNWKLDATFCKSGLMRSNLVGGNFEWQKWCHFVYYPSKV